MMIKLSFEQLEKMKGWEKAVIVFTVDSFDDVYSEEQRSYVVASGAKYFDANMGGASLFGNCLDGTDFNVRLDVYMKLLPNEGRRWNVDYCYILKS